MKNFNCIVLLSLFSLLVSAQTPSGVSLKSYANESYHSPIYFRMSEYPPGYYASIVPAVQTSGITLLKFNVALGEQEQNALTIRCGDTYTGVHGNISIGSPWMDQKARLAVHQGHALPQEAGTFTPLMTVGGLCQSNTMKNTQWLVRTNNDTTWVSTKWHDGIWIDSSFDRPGTNTKVWWERNPYGNTQAWGNQAETYMILKNGNLGIGCSDPQNKLEVFGTIRAKEIIVTETGWADFVFDENYALPSLQEVERHIKANKRLPDIPGEQEVRENGVSLGEINARLLQKVEELTLYIIDLEKRMNKLENNNE